jgi:hypothetical protein
MGMVVAIGQTANKKSDTRQLAACRRVALARPRAKAGGRSRANGVSRSRPTASARSRGARTPRSNYIRLHIAHSRTLTSSGLGTAGGAMPFR